MPLKSAPISRARIRALCRIVRQACGHDTMNPCVNIVHIAENVIGLLLKDPDYTFEVRAVEDMPAGLEGLSLPLESSIYIREDVYEAACNGDGRARMTIAHEIGHYLLHDGSTLALAKQDANETIPTYCDPEWQANCFAGELLMPHDLIVDMTTNDIQRRCKVSMAAAKYQKTKK